MSGAVNDSTSVALELEGWTLQVPDPATRVAGEIWNVWLSYLSNLSYWSNCQTCLTCFLKCLINLKTFPYILTYLAHLSCLNHPTCHTWSIDKIAREMGHGCSFQNRSFKFFVQNSLTNGLGTPGLQFLNFAIITWPNLTELTQSVLSSPITFGIPPFLLSFF